MVKMVILQNITMIDLHNITNYINKIPANNYHLFFYQFLLPLMFCLIVFLYITFKVTIDRFIKNKFANFGYVQIWYIKTNRRINIKMIKLDEFGNFHIGKKRYSLERMYHFVIGYRENIPVFMYDSTFILPLVIEKKKIDDKIKAEYKKAGIDLKDTDVSGISIKLEPQILELVYKKKLISDLYSSVKTNDSILLWILIAIGVIAVLYFTGALEPILNALGIHLHPVTQATNSTISNITTNATSAKTIIIPK